MKIPKIVPANGPLKSREEYITQFRNTVARHASYDVPGHVLSLCDRLVVESRFTRPGEPISNWLGLNADLNRHQDDLDHCLATVCLMRGLEMKPGATEGVQRAITKMLFTLAVLADQLQAHEQDATT